MACESLTHEFEYFLLPDAVLDLVPADGLHCAAIEIRLNDAWNPEIPLHHRVQMDIELKGEARSIGLVDVLAETWESLSAQSRSGSRIDQSRG